MNSLIRTHPRALLHSRDRGLDGRGLPRGVRGTPCLFVTHPYGCLCPQGSPACPASSWGEKRSAEVKGSEPGDKTPELSLHHRGPISPTQMAALVSASVSPICQLSRCLPTPLPPPPAFRRLVNMFSQTPRGSVGWAQGGTWRLRGRKAPGQVLTLVTGRNYSWLGLGLARS